MYLEPVCTHSNKMYIEVEVFCEANERIGQDLKRDFRRDFRGRVDLNRVLSRD